MFYDYDANAILTEALPDRRGSSIRDAWLRIFNLLQDNGYAPKLHILDNECSTYLKKAFSKHNVDFKRVPAHQHRRNAAERAIQTWKNHFPSGLISVDPAFPLSAWDHLLPQCNISLNLLRSSRRQPKLSAHACLFGNFDFNRTPLAVPGTRVIIHETPAQRRTFALHGLDGFYVGPSLEHYRCHKILVSSTQATRDCVSVEWFPSLSRSPKSHKKTTSVRQLTISCPSCKNNLHPLHFHHSPTVHQPKMHSSKLHSSSNEPLHLFRHLRMPLLQHPFLTLMLPQEHHHMFSLPLAPIFKFSLYQQQHLRQHLRGCRSREYKLRGCRSRGRQLRGCWPKNLNHLLHLFLQPPPTFHLLFPVLHRPPSTLQRVR